MLALLLLIYLFFSSNFKTRFYKLMINLCFKKLSSFFHWKGLKRITNSVAKNIPNTKADLYNYFSLKTKQKQKPAFSGQKADSRSGSGNAQDEWFLSYRREESYQRPQGSCQEDLDFNLHELPPATDRTITASIMTTATIHWNTDRFKSIGL